MTDLLRRRLGVVAFILLCSVTTGLASWKMHTWGSDLSPVDRGSEANAFREVDGFQKEGFWKNQGLGNVMFGPLFPGSGFVTNDPEDRARMVTPSGVYTHYPPGPEYILFAEQAVLGLNPVWRLRILPLLFCGGAAIYFGMSIRRRFGPTVGWLMMLAIAVTVPMHDANSSIHFMGYALALLLIEIALSVQQQVRRWPFLLLGFVQGWLSFDYAFLVVGTPMAVELSLPLIEGGTRARLWLAFQRCFLAGLGFLIAHLAHFAEVWAFYGSIADAVADLSNSARYRAVGTQEHGVADFVVGALHWINHFVVSSYPVNVPLINHVPGPAGWLAFRFLGVTLGIWWLAAALVMTVVEVQRRINGLRPLHLLPRWLGVGVIGVGTCSVWWVIMQKQTSEHIHLFYRHLSVCFVLWVLFVAVQMTPWIDRALARWFGNRASGTTAGGAAGLLTGTSRAH